MVRVIACGGRDYQRRGRVFAVLDAAVQRLGLDVLLTGGASGADHIAQAWARERNVPNEIFRAHWGKEGPGAGPIRNKRMLVEGRAELVIAFPGGDGTANMVDIAEKAGVRVIKIDWQDQQPEEGKLV